MNTKTLNFFSYNLAKTNVVLVFRPPKSSRLYRDQFPVVWKVMTFRGPGHGKAFVKYSARLAFGYAQTDADSLVSTAAWTELKTNDITGASGAPGDSTKHFVCKNNSDVPADLNIGLVSGDGTNESFEPTLIFRGVGAGSTLTAQFTPVLQAYVTRDYQVSQLLRGEMETDRIWETNLDEIDEVTSWAFREDDSTGEFSITPAGGA
ncbi:hypothetical protein FRC08_003706 [Ceratobasidium sp. 394]|nr:hypothetical protein FRC08_003706 [Ceratobasidium sp. 394]